MRVAQEKLQYQLLLNMGTSTTGAVKTTALSFGSFIDPNPSDQTTADANALTLAGLIGACLSKSVYEFRKVSYSQILN